MQERTASALMAERRNFVHHSESTGSAKTSQPSALRTPVFSCGLLDRRPAFDLGNPLVKYFPSGMFFQVAYNVPINFRAGLGDTRERVASGE